MDRKISGAILKNDYRTLEKFIPAGTPIYFDGELWVCNGENWQAFFTEKQITKNETGLFDIEYETERKSITVKIEYDYSPGDSPLSVTNIAYSLDGDYNINPKVREVTND